MGRDKFKEELEALGHSVELQDPDKTIINYTIGEGRFAGRVIKLGFQIPADYEMTPPGGIHISPQLIAINPNAQNHSRSTESQPFGAGWQYLSRPFAGKWALKRSGKRYMEYVVHLLNTL